VAAGPVLPPAPPIPTVTMGLVVPGPRGPMLPPPPAPKPPPVAAPGSSPSPAAPGAAGGPALPPPPPKPAATEAEAKSLVAPVTGQATATQPDAMVPQEARTKPPAVRRQPPSRKLQPGDLVCAECGEGNAVTRKFCARCGTSLAEATIVKTPWWRKLLPRRGAKVRKSGERPKRRGRAGKSRLGVFVSTTFKTLRRVIALALVIGGVLYGLVTPFRGWVNDRAMEAKGTVERTFFPTYAPVSAAEAPAASIEVPGHPGNDAVDGLKNTYWGSPVGVLEPNLVVKFDRKIDLAKLIIHNGDGAAFKDTYRAAKLHLVFSTGKTADIDLQDLPDPQTLDVENGEGITYVEIHVVQQYKSVTNSVLAISEIEFREEL
jgi:hypothetical protein